MRTLAEFFFATLLKQFYFCSNTSGSSIFTPPGTFFLHTYDQEEVQSLRGCVSTQDLCENIHRWIVNSLVRWTFPPVADIKWSWSLLNNRAAVSCLEKHQCCQGLQWEGAVTALFIWARIHHSATREQQMRGTFGLPETDCLLETQTCTHPPISNTLILLYSMLRR